MANQKPISWSNSTWNPINGGTKCSAGYYVFYSGGFTNRLHKSPLTDKYVAGLITINEGWAV